MQRMIDLIRASAVPANIVHSAAKGALSVPADEMVEILVYLASHNQVFGEEASLTLAGWDETSSQHIAADPATSPEVLSYLVSHRNLRPVLLPPLLENPAVPEEALAELAAVATPDVLESILKSPRAAQSPLILEALRANPNCPPMENPAPPAIAESTLAKSTLAEPSPDAPAAAETAPSNPPEPPSSPAEDDDVLVPRLWPTSSNTPAKSTPTMPPFTPSAVFTKACLIWRNPVRSLPATAHLRPTPERNPNPVPTWSAAARSRKFPGWMSKDGHGEDVGEQDGGVERKALQRLQRDFGGIVDVRRQAHEAAGARRVALYSGR